MRITDQQLARFSSMLRDFSMKNGLTAEMDTGLGMERSDILLSNNYKFKRYAVLWSEVTSLTDAGTRIFADALNFFGLNGGASCSGEFEIKGVIFNDPATIVLWADGTKTVVKCQEGDLYSEELGLAMCFAKKALGNKGNFNNVFHKWIPEVGELDDSPVVFTLPELAPCDQLAAQNAIKQMQASKPRSAADILADLLGNRRGYMRGI